MISMSAPNSTNLNPTRLNSFACLYRLMNSTIINPQNLLALAVATETVHTFSVLEIRKRLVDSPQHAPIVANFQGQRRRLGVDMDTDTDMVNIEDLKIADC